MVFRLVPALTVHRVRGKKMPLTGLRFLMCKMEIVTGCSLCLCVSVSHTHTHTRFTQCCCLCSCRPHTSPCCVIYTQVSCTGNSRKGLICLVYTTYPFVMSLWNMIYGCVWGNRDSFGTLRQKVGLLFHTHYSETNPTITPHQWKYIFLLTIQTLAIPSANPLWINTLHTLSFLNGRPNCIRGKNSTVYTGIIFTLETGQ